MCDCCDSDYKLKGEYDIFELISDLATYGSNRETTVIDKAELEGLLLVNEVTNK